MFDKIHTSDYIKYDIETDFSKAFVLAVCDISEQNQLIQSFEDIKFFTTSYENVIEKDNYIVMTEDLDMYKNLFYSSDESKSKFIKAQKMIALIYISDNKNVKTNTSFITIVFKFTKNKENIIFQYNYVHEIVEKLKNLKVISNVSIKIIN